MQNITRIAIPALAAFLTLSACATTGRDAPLADGSDVALGQRAYVDGPLVQPIAVLEMHSSTPPRSSSRPSAATRRIGCGWRRRT